MKTLLWTVSFFALMFLFHIVFLFYLHFCILSHFEIIRCIANSLIATSTCFVEIQLKKRKLEKSFLGTRVWASKPVYWSPKLAKCVTAYRRNWHHLLKSRDPEPVQMQFDIEPELDNTNLEINTEPPENCSATITTSNTSKKLPLLHIIINNKLLI